MSTQRPDRPELNPDLIRQVLDCTGASSVARVEAVQKLWSGYGQIVRLVLDYSRSRQGTGAASVVVKSISPPATPSHPRGWDSDASMQRKLESYRVEATWYREYSESCRAVCALPRLYASQLSNGQSWFVFEDLDREYPLRHDTLSEAACEPCLAWLAHFHAHHLGSPGKGLWPTGTYWHLQTRREEYDAMDEGDLKEAAKKLDARLANCQYKTLVHGDAKVANICFPQTPGPVAMVDFQYVGGGCGIRDVAYFLGSCLSEKACEYHAERLLDVYFDSLRQCLPSACASAVETEWRNLYAIAWADFHRFLAGWMPTHQKINGYTRRLTQEALAQI